MAASPTPPLWRIAVFDYRAQAHLLAAAIMTGFVGFAFVRHFVVAPGALAVFVLCVVGWLVAAALRIGTVARLFERGLAVPGTITHLAISARRKSATCTYSHEGTAATKEFFLAYGGLEENQPVVVMLDSSNPGRFVVREVFWRGRLSS